MKRFLSLLLTMAMLCGCAAPTPQPEEAQYSATFLDVFDTVTTVVGRAESEEAFSEQAEQVHSALLEYHRLFDIYHQYDGINNLKTINDKAGTQPVEADDQVIQLLEDCKQYYRLTDGKVNAAMGSVLSLWHTARNNGINDPANAVLPDDAALQAAALHTNFDDIIIDTQAGTVFFSDPALQLDVGAIAKGWATQRVAEAAPEGLLISVGGNVCATGPKDRDGNPWVVAIQNPETNENYLHTLYVTGGSVVTSGDYQRTYMVDGKSYHHIIDPETLYPSEYWRSVTVVCPDSGLADALSTALFLLPLEEGQALLKECGAEAMWVDREANRFYSDGFEHLIRS